MAINYSFSPCHDRMPEPVKNQGVPNAARRGVFRQGEAGSRVGLYARVSTHDQQTLPLPLSAMREHAEHRGWTVVVAGEGVRTRLLPTCSGDDPLRAAASAR